MKVCTKCSKSKPLTEFNRRSRSPDGHMNWCRDCKHSYDAGWYQQNRERHIRNVRPFARRFRQTERAYAQSMKQVPCADCGKEYPPYVMDYDHVRGSKVTNVSYLAGFARQRLRDEIEKCDVVCANCHRERTFGPQNRGLTNSA